MFKILIWILGGHTEKELATAVKNAVEKKAGEFTPLPVPPFLEDFPSAICSCHEHGWFTQTYGGFYPAAWVANGSHTVGYAVHCFLESWLRGLGGSVPMEIPWVKLSVSQEGCPCGSFGGASTAKMKEGTTFQEIEEWVHSLDPFKK